MKRILPILLLTGFAFANPIMAPSVHINEFMFDQNGKWWLEIILSCEGHNYPEQFDSILISSSTGTSKIHNNLIKDNQPIIVVTSDSLDNPLNITDSGDYVKVSSYHNQYLIDFSDTLSFGDYPGSMFPKIETGFSITNILGFRLDKTPTIGMPNDTSGVCGTLSGYVYNKNGSIVTTGSYELFRYTMITPDNTGHYRTRMMNGKYLIYDIGQFIQPGEFRYVWIDSLEFSIGLDSTVYLDINFLSDYVAIAVNPLTLHNYKIEVKTYPNPFNNQMTFRISAPPNITNKNAYIDIYNIAGERIRSIFIGSSSYAHWNGCNDQSVIQSAGVYFYKLRIDNRDYHSGSVIYLK